MPTLKLTDLASCKTYFANIATLHKEVDVFKWGDLELVQKNNRSGMKSETGSRVLWAKPYDGADYQDAGSDNAVKNKLFELRYMLPCRDTAPQSEKEAAATATEAVIEQIVARMLRDKRGGMVGDKWTMVAFRVAGMKTENFEITVGSTHYIGCELQLTFQDNTHLAYDETKWNAEP
jgi:hypothetical protein